MWFNNISAISLRSISLEKTVLLVEETEVHITQRCNESSSPGASFELTKLVVMDTDCRGSCKSNFHTITSPVPTSQRWV